MIGIICLIIGILGFIKGRINVTKKRELRGAPMYIVAALFCLPLPFSFLAGVVLAANHAAQGTPIDQNTLLFVSLGTSAVPIVIAMILGFTLAKPKEVAGAPRAQGFEVKI